MTGAQGERGQQKPMDAWEANWLKHKRLYSYDEKKNDKDFKTVYCYFLCFS